MTAVHPDILAQCHPCVAHTPRVHRAALILAGAFVTVLSISLSRSLFDPLGFDQAMYQYQTEQIMAGQREHAAFWSGNALGIYVPHWLATVLLGTSPAALRIFDACWQLLVLSALVLLGARDGRRWAVGWLAATLYAVVYYGSGYIHTAQREGFAVLPLLVLAHAVIARPAKERPNREWIIVGLHFIGGALAVLVLALKPPLGMCYGAVWLLTLAEAWNRRREGVTAFARVAALSAGFILSALGAMMLLVHLGLWSGYDQALTLGGQMPPGYVRGPDLVRRMLPFVLPAAVILTVVIGVALRARAGTAVPAGISLRRERARCLAAGLIVFALLWLNHRCEEWKGPFAATAGLLLPALGAVLISAWPGRSRVWRVCMLMGGAALGGAVLQGHFFVYHLMPFFAFISYLSAAEIHDRLRSLAPSSRGERVWAAVCLAGVVHLLISHWGWTMTFCSRSPYVLSDATLVEHYTRITKHKTSYPAYGTTVRTADRVRELTLPTEPIVCLFRYPGLYHLARRPAAHPLICINDWTRFLFPDFLKAVREQRPRVAVARVPAHARRYTDPAAIQAAVCDDLESFFGRDADFIRHAYRVTDVIDDVCLLQPVELGRQPESFPK